LLIIWSITFGIILIVCGRITCDNLIYENYLRVIEYQKRPFLALTIQYLKITLILNQNSPKTYPKIKGLNYVK
jgi:hypothetical protein